jgi:hypothetical protein
VPVIITADFHAAKDISSDFVVSNDVDIRGKLNWMDINLVGYPLLPIVWMKIMMVRYRVVKRD